MSDAEYEDQYADAAAEERERAADWDDHVRHWEVEARDHRDRDSGENPYLPKKGMWPTHAERVRHAGYSDGDPKSVIVP